MAIRFTIFPPGDAANPSIIAFDLEKVVVGRGAICDLRLPNPAVSWHHATVEVDGPRYSIRDVGSTNGTLVNGTRIPPDFKHVIHTDDVIEIAGFRIMPTLAVPMEGTHSDERTEAVARSLLLIASPDHEPARLEVITGPDEGLGLDLEAGRTVQVGRSSTCDLRLSDPDVSDVHAEIRRVISGWSMVASEGDIAVDGSSRRECRLADGQTIAMGSTVIGFSDPLDAYYTKLLRTREDLEPVEPRTPAPGEVESAPAAPPPEDNETRPSLPPTEDGPITSRSEVVDAGTNRSRMPEYSWMVVLLGVLAFLASLGLLLLLIL